MPRAGQGQGGQGSCRCTWHDLLRDGRAAQHVAFLQHGRAHPCLLQVGSLRGARHHAAHPYRWKVSSSPQAPSWTWCPPHQGGPHSPQPCGSPQRHGHCHQDPPSPTAQTLTGSPLSPGDGGDSTLLLVLTATSPLCPARREGGEQSPTSGQSHSTEHPATPGAQGCHNPPDNRVPDMGMEVTGSILPWPYRPGPNNAGEGGKRCSRQMPQLCPACWGAATCAWPCLSPASSLAQGACQGSATCPAPLWSPPGH